MFSKLRQPIFRQLGIKEKTESHYPGIIQNVDYLDEKRN